MEGPYLGRRGAMMAEGVGFEPTRPFRACRFSRPVLSTAQTPLPEPDQILSRRSESKRLTTTTRLSSAQPRNVAIPCRNAVSVSSPAQVVVLRTVGHGRPRLYIGVRVKIVQVATSKRK